MGGFLFSLASFVVAIGVLVTVHEYGHFWVARRLGASFGEVPRGPRSPQGVLELPLRRASWSAPASRRLSWLRGCRALPLDAGLS